MAYQEIVNFLSTNHNIVKSLRHLKRILHRLELKRKGMESDIEEICVATVKELHGTGCYLGYKSMHRRLQLLDGIQVKRSTVAKIL